MILYAFVTFFGYIDARLKQKIQFKRLILIIVALAPLGLSKGARIFLFGPVSAYALSFFVAIKFETVHKFIRKNQKGIIATVLLIYGLGFLFSYLADLREGSSGSIVFDIMSWMASTIAALDTWITVAWDYPQTYGTCMFNWFATLLSDVKILNVEYTHPVYFSSIELQNLNDMAWCIPSGIIPSMIMDYKEFGLTFATVLLLFVLEVFSSKQNVSSLNELMIQGFLTSFSFGFIQSPYLFGNTVIVSIFWQYVILYVSCKLFKYNIQDMRRFHK
jgi:hypothetical protein